MAAGFLNLTLLSNGAFVCLQGDSGGGLVCRRRLTLEQVLSGKEDFGPRPYTLRGIISYGAGCGAPASPGVYTDVGFFRRWIDQHLAG